MELHGLTPVDTLYEYAGYVIGSRFAETLIWNGIFPALLAGAAILKLYYTGVKRASFLDLAIYPLYLLFIAFLVWPVDISITGPGGADDGHEWDPVLRNDDTQSNNLRAATVPVPRVLGVVNTAADSVVTHMVSIMEPEFNLTAYAWQRAAAVNERARIIDHDLRRVFHEYVNYCYWPASNRAGIQTGWDNVPLMEGPEFTSLYQDNPRRYTVHHEQRLTSLYEDRGVYTGEVGWSNLYRSTPYDEEVRAGGPWGAFRTPCAELRTILRDQLKGHLLAEPYHQTALDAYVKADRQNGESSYSQAQLEDFYTQRILYNETFLDPASNEVSMVREALPGYEFWNQNHWGVGGASIYSHPDQIPGQIASGMVAQVASVFEWWNLESMGPSTYYRISAFGPYMYGLITAVLLMGFPIAALMAFWPGSWTAIVNFLKVFVSVKLWPIFWAFLSRMNVVRGHFDPSDRNGFEGTFGTNEMFASIAGMYLIVPVLTFTLVSLSVRAGSVTMGAMVGTSQAGNPRDAAMAGASGAKAAGGIGSLAGKS